jgi:hypothetical protein
MSWNGFNNLNLGGVEAESGRKTLEPGSYTCKITGAEIKDTKDGYGKGLVVTLKDVEGRGEVEDFINLHNRNPQAVEIGMKRLKALLVNCGHPNPDRPGDVKSIIGRTVGVHVEKGDDWKDKEGNLRPGGGKPRKSGAYFKPEGVSETTGSSDTSRQGYLDDDVPF